MNDLEKMFDKISKKYNKSSIVEINEETDLKVTATPTGCFSLDEAFGCGGMPRGRIIELFGEESQGKSTIAMFLIAQMQKSGGVGAYIDAEFAFDSDFAKKIGIDLSSDKLILSQPDTLEEAFDTIQAMVESNSVDIIVVDSVASLVPKVEFDSAMNGEMLKDTIGLQARLMSKGLKILTGPISKSKTTVIFINQIRDKIGVMFGLKTTTPGGKALKFYSSVRMEVKTGDKFEDSDGKRIGNTLKIAMVKNKVGNPFGRAEFDLYYAKGIDLISDTVEYGIKKGVIIKTGNTHTFNGEKIGIGKEQVKKFLSENSDVYEKIREEIRKK